MYMFDISGSGTVAARRQLQADAAADHELQEERPRSDSLTPSIEVQVARLLANRDPTTGRRLTSVDDLPDHLSEEDREDEALKRDCMFHGRDPTRPWMLADGTGLLV